LAIKIIKDKKEIVVKIYIMFNIFTLHVHKEINCHKIKLVQPLNVICQTHTKYITIDSAWVSDCCSTPTQQFVCYIMARTS